jgi:hypothetical protein
MAAVPPSAIARQEEATSVEIASAAPAQGADEPLPGTRAPIDPAVLVAEFAEMETQNSQDAVPETGFAPTNSEVEAQPEASARESAEQRWQTALEDLLQLAREEAASETPSGNAGLWAARQPVLERLARVDDGLALIEWLDAEGRNAVVEIPPASEATVEQTGREADDGASAADEKPAFAIVELLFCRKVEGFGNYETRESESFGAGDSVGVYWEIEGLASEFDGGWHRTRLETRLEIVSRNDGAVVWHRSLGQAEDLCRKVRRDFFVNARLTVPEELTPGNYDLRVIVADLVAGEVATRSVSFRIE